MCTWSGIALPQPHASTSARSIGTSGDPEQFPTRWDVRTRAERTGAVRARVPLARSETGATGRRAASELPALSGTPEPQAYRGASDRLARRALRARREPSGIRAARVRLARSETPEPRARLTRHRIPMPPPRGDSCRCRTSSRDRLRGLMGVEEATQTNLRRIPRLGHGMTLRRDDRLNKTLTSPTITGATPK